MFFKRTINNVLYILWVPYVVGIRYVFWATKALGLSKLLSKILFLLGLKHNDAQKLELLFPIGDFQQKKEYKEKYDNLVKGLDVENKKNVDLLIERSSNAMKLGKYSYVKSFSKTEKTAIKLLKKEFYSKLLRLPDGIFSYDNKYFLPIFLFEANIFYYEMSLPLSMRESLMNSNKAIIDVGAFIGDTAIVLANITKCKVYAFEPAKDSYQLMQKTIELNKNGNLIIPVNKGLGSTCAISNVTFSGAAMAIENEHNDHTQQIEITTLDKYVEENKISVGLIKVDIEGFEQEFLKGAEKVIKEQSPILSIAIYHSLNDFFNIKPIIEKINSAYTFRIIKPLDVWICEETLLICEVKK